MLTLLSGSGCSVIDASGHRREAAGRSPPPRPAASFDTKRQAVIENVLGAACWAAAAHAPFCVPGVWVAIRVASWDA